MNINRKNNLGCFFKLLFVFVFLGYAIGGVGGIFYGALWAVIINGIVSGFSNPNYSKVIDQKVLSAISKLSLLVMKADSGISQSELYVFRDFMLQNFGSEATADAIEFMRGYQYHKISSQEAADTINAKLNYSEKMQILQFLFQLAAADGAVQPLELALLSRIAQEMQIRQTDFMYVKNMYDYLYSRHSYQQNQSYQNQYSTPQRRDALADAYASLGMKSTDSNEEIKAAYRRLAIANHPDKVQHLGETARREAEKRFSKINEAYNRIKKARNL
jgi:DnaJ like chaperone protein